MAPAVNVIPHFQNFGFNNRATSFLRSKIRTRQKHLPNSHQLIDVRLVPCALNLIIEKRYWNLQMNARAIAGFPIRIHRTAMPNRLQRGDARLNHSARRRTIHGNHKPHTTRRVLIIFAVQPLLGHQRALGFFFGYPFGVILGHFSLLQGSLVT